MNKKVQKAQKNCHLNINEKICSFWLLFYFVDVDIISEN